MRVLARTTPFRSVKALGQGRFEGVAWSLAHQPDISGDIILPSAIESAIERHTKARTRPDVLIEHDKGLLAGAIVDMHLTDRGLEVTGQVDMGSTIGRGAMEKMQSGELPCLSIGAEAMAEKYGSGHVFFDMKLEEVSLCLQGKNFGARISDVKSWTDVSTQRDLERLLRDVAGMPNRLARKTAHAAWPVIDSNSNEGDELNAALRQLIGATP
ncbi:hypothetical protein E2F46_10990 [Luteimonas aestuarii]|uniref:HK97 family phage prohead protease n=1 Tax=Luteimonas aestuarii TaxID=453837 RepID=A0A4R5TSQ9_9GAMM|nr:hypothetical protein [Luteimonas aestuarii]TDK23437.1 hypothetical protein E2F46_10990 [Luteimonas aestuarii]